MLRRAAPPRALAQRAARLARRAQHHRHEPRDLRRRRRRRGGLPCAQGDVSNVTSCEGLGASAAPAWWAALPRQTPCKTDLNAHDSAAPSLRTPQQAMLGWWCHAVSCTRPAPNGICHTAMTCILLEQVYQELTGEQHLWRRSSGGRWTGRRSHGRWTCWTCGTCCGRTQMWSPSAPSPACSVHGFARSTAHAAHTSWHLILVMLAVNRGPGGAPVGRPEDAAEVGGGILRVLAARHALLVLLAAAVREVAPAQRRPGLARRPQRAGWGAVWVGAGRRTLNRRSGLRWSSTRRLLASSPGGTASLCCRRSTTCHAPQAPEACCSVQDTRPSRGKRGLHLHLPWTVLLQVRDAAGKSLHRRVWGSFPIAGVPVHRRSSHGVSAYLMLRTRPLAADAMCIKQVRLSTRAAAEGARWNRMASLSCTTSGHEGCRVGEGEQVTNA